MIEWRSITKGNYPLQHEYLGVTPTQEQYYKRLEVAVIIDDKIKYYYAYYDGYKWFLKNNQVIDNIQYWRPLDDSNTNIKSGIYGENYISEDL